MSVLVCGSIAYDTLLTFQDSFSKHILPDQLHKLSVCFMVPHLRREFGGCAGNIAYNLKMLGGDPVILSSAGDDFGPYRQHLQRQGLRTDGIREIADCYTAQCFITSDRDDNQITAFHPGATDFATLNHAGQMPGIELAIVAPSGHQADLQHARELSAAGVPYFFDPGQELPLLSDEELCEMIERATYLALNDYEAEMMQARTGLTLSQLAGQVDALVVTRGAQGSDIYADRHYRIEGVPAERVVDPTGCGDAYRAGLLYGISHGLGWLASGRLASMLGAIKIASRGGQNHVFDWPGLARQYQTHFGDAWPGQMP
ncbi:MAG: carbohydrate kinase family protein [Microvirgula sp.]